MAGVLNQPPVEQLLARSPNRSRYTLVAMAAKRARQLLEGAPPLVSVDSTKPVTIALHEISQGRLVCEVPRVGGIK